MIDSRVKDALDHIAYLITSYKVERDDFANVGANSEAQILARMITKANDEAPEEYGD